MTRDARMSIATTILATVAILGGCSSAPSGGADAGGLDALVRTCEPGRPVACVGAAGCSGSQVCVADGSGYGPCDCRGDEIDASTTDAADILDAGTDAGATEGDGGTISDDAGDPLPDAGGEGDGGVDAGPTTTLDAGADAGAGDPCSVPAVSLPCSGAAGCSGFRTCLDTGFWSACDCPDAGACGGFDEPCCADPTTPCRFPGSICSGGLCLHCGAEGEQCCADTPRCSAPRTACAPTTGLCERCGAHGEMCCAGSAVLCDDGEPCDTYLHPEPGVCGCGRRGELCCDGFTCQPGLTCLPGTPGRRVCWS